MFDPIRMPPSVVVDGRLPLDGGDLACVGPIRFTPAAGKVRLVVETRANPVPPLRITARTNTVTKTTVVSNYKSGEVTDIRVPFTVKDAASGSVCIRNTGDSRVSLASTDEARYASLTRTKLNGKPAKMQASLQLITTEPQSIVDRIDDAVRHNAQLSGVLPRALVWLLLLTVLIAVIAGPLYVMTDVLRRDDESPE